MKVLKDLDPFGLQGCFIAGGAVLSHVTKTEISDYDVYPKTKQYAIDAVIRLMESDCFVVNVSNKANTLKCNSITNKFGDLVDMKMVSKMV